MEKIKRNLLVLKVVIMLLLGCLIFVFFGGLESYLSIKKEAQEELFFREVNALLLDEYGPDAVFEDMDDIRMMLPDMPSRRFEQKMASYTEEYALLRGISVEYGIRSYPGIDSYSRLRGFSKTLEDGIWYIKVKDIPKDEFRWKVSTYLALCNQDFNEFLRVEPVKEESSEGYDESELPNDSADEGGMFRNPFLSGGPFQYSTASGGGAVSSANGGTGAVSIPHSSVDPDGQREEYVDASGTISD